MSEATAFKILLSFGPHTPSSISYLDSLLDRMRSFYVNQPNFINAFFIEAFDNTKEEEDFINKYAGEGHSFVDGHFHILFQKLESRAPEKEDLEKYKKRMLSHGKSFVVAEYEMADRLRKDFLIHIYFEPLNREQSIYFSDLLRQDRKLQQEMISLFLQGARHNQKVMEITKKRFDILYEFIAKRNQLFVEHLINLIDRCQKTGKKLRYFARWGSGHSAIYDLLRSINASLSEVEVIREDNNYVFSVREMAAQKTLNFSIEFQENDYWRAILNDAVYYIFNKKDSPFTKSNFTRLEIDTFLRKLNSPTTELNEISKILQSTDKSELDKIKLIERILKSS